MSQSQFIVKIKKNKINSVAIIASQQNWKLRLVAQNTEPWPSLKRLRFQKIFQSQNDTFAREFELKKWYIAVRPEVADQYLIINEYKEPWPKEKIFHYSLTVLSLSVAILAYLKK